MARHSAPMNCSESDLLELQHLAEHSKNKGVAERAQMMIACAQGTLIKDVAIQFKTRPNTVIEWKKRYTKFGIAGLASKPRGNSKDVYGDEFKERLVETFNSPPPEGKKYWTGPLLAKQLNAPVPAVRRYLTKAGIHLNEQRLRDAQECRDSEGDATAKVFDAKDKTSNAKKLDPFVNEPDIIEQFLREEAKEDNAPEENAPVDKDRDKYWDLGVIFFARDKEGNIREASSSIVENVLGSHDTFNISNLEGFLDDFGLYENGLSQIIGAGVNAFTREHLGETSKKKTVAEPYLPQCVRQVRGEYSTTSFTSVEDLATGLGPKEIIVSRGQADIEEMLCTSKSYRKSAADLDRIQHRLSASHVDSRNLQRRIVKAGMQEWDMDMEHVEKLLDEAGFDPVTALKRNDGVLEKYIKEPKEESNEVKFARVEDVVRAYNEGKMPEYQIKNKDFMINIEDCPEDAIICSPDGILVSHQNEQRAVKGRKPYKSKENVENIILHVSVGKESYIITAKSMFEGFKKFIAFALENGLRKGVPVIFFSDGAKDIKKAIETYFSFYPCRFFLDWYHLQKKVRQLIASAFKGTAAEKNKIHNEIMGRLWAGNVAEARAYINSLNPQLVRDEKAFASMQTYLDNRDPNLYCYALRKELGLRNASSPVEKANDRVVAERQKNNLTSWSFTGSWALAAVTARRLNAGTKFKCRLTAQPKSA